MPSEAQKRAAAKYDAANTKQFTLKLNRTTDADIIRRLDDSANKQGYIKSMIRKDIDMDASDRYSGGLVPLSPPYLTTSGAHPERDNEHAEQLFLRSDGRIVCMCWVVCMDDPDLAGTDLASHCPTDEPDDIVLLGPSEDDE